MLLRGVVISLKLCHSLVSAQWPDPVSSTGNLSYVHDPSVVQKDGTYYRFSTFGGIHIASAPDMTGPWTYLGAALPNGSRIALSGNHSLWAPDVSLVDGTYYMYYAVSVSGSQDSDIGVATSQDLTPGSWTDHGSIGVPKNSSYNKIDPNLFIDDTGSSTPLLSFGSYWHDIYQTQTADPPLSVAEGDTEPTNIEYNSTARAEGGPPQVMEGSYQFKYQDASGKSWYYLFWSSGACCNTPPHLAPAGDEYKIMVARSQSPTGPWLDDQGRDARDDNGGKLVLGSHGNGVYAPGGQGVMYDTKTSSPLMYYHYIDRGVGYGVYDFHFGFNYLDFGSGWPVVVQDAVANSSATQKAPASSSSSSSSSAASGSMPASSGGSVADKSTAAAAASFGVTLNSAWALLAVASFFIVYM